ncbi:unnamed protein product [Lepeophtheirus salmonis]|uniref:(salmon louse) hypothetical protein n=1 Tax=Lepeophtheirus salmonis TaxID=72036 RepID=A0A7R8H7U9_LEPSM|nr:unnamed protein product [Lepeophtheirus salmonis]CAF2925757.1 unnamed protein product [Lepeophtheirus salmonis]
MNRVIPSFQIRIPSQLLIALLLGFDHCFNGVTGSCYFPAAFQGEYMTQASSSQRHFTYSNLSINYNSIPVWGFCHRRLGNNVILMDDAGVLSSVMNKCYTSEDRAVKDCPRDGLDSAKEVILYRTKGIMGEPGANPTYCPINGAFTFTYTIHDGTKDALKCSSQTSEVSDCPYGFGLHFQFKRCSFGDMEFSFHCLGDWDSGQRSGERYIALMDIQATSKDVIESRPRYRCALYKKNEESGEISLALSADSSCSSQLISSEKGYETLLLSPQTKPAQIVNQGQQQACFPSFAQGKWEYLEIKGDVLEDQSSILRKYIIFARTHCGEETYKCLWLKNRGDNALEFKLGSYSSKNPVEELCDDESFVDETWRTQGRLSVTDPTPYPIIGEYTGVIPDTDGLCAKLYSDCNNPEIMFYTIFNCFNRSEIFEEREYSCLGQWTDEDDGLIYTGDIFLREASHNCERGQTPKRNGMKLTQVSKCYGRFRKKPFHPSTSISTEPTYETNSIDRLLASGGDSRWSTSSVGLPLILVWIYVMFFMSLFSCYFLITKKD